MRALTAGVSMGGNARGGKDPLRLVAFDMDGVLVDHVSSWAAVHDALGTQNSGAVASYLAGEIDDREFILRDVALWRGARPEFGPGDLQQILARVPRMFAMREAVAAVRAQGATCAIVTGGLRGLAEMLVREAGFSHFRANDVVFGKDGRLQDDAVVDVPLRNKGGVLAALQDRLGVSPAQTAAIGDSQFDVGLFARSRISVAFNPLDEAASQHATHVVRGRDLRVAVAPVLDGMTLQR